MIVLNEGKEGEKESVSRHTRNTYEKQVALRLPPLKDVRGLGIYWLSEDNIWESKAQNKCGL